MSPGGGALTIYLGPSFGRRCRIFSCTLRTLLESASPGVSAEARLIHVLFSQSKSKTQDSLASRSLLVDKERASFTDRAILICCSSIDSCPRMLSGVVRSGSSRRRFSETPSRLCSATNSKALAYFLCCRSEDQE